MGKNYMSIIGRLTDHPELRTTPSGKRVTEFTVAVNTYKNKVEYIPVIAWEAQAEILCNNLKKSYEIALDGKWDTNRWKDKNGNNRKDIRMLVTKIDLIGNPDRKKDSDSSEFNSYSSGVAQFNQPDDDLPF